MFLKNADIIVAFDCYSRNDSKLIELTGDTEKILDSGEFDMGSDTFLRKNC